MDGKSEGRGSKDLMANDDAPCVAVHDKPTHQPYYEARYDRCSFIDAKSRLCHALELWNLNIRMAC